MRTTAFYTVGILAVHSSLARAEKFVLTSALNSTEFILLANTMSSALRVSKLATRLGKNAATACPSSARRASSIVALAKPERTSPFIAAGTVLSLANAAHADDSVDTAVNAIVDVIKATGDAVKVGLGVAQQGLESAQQAYQTVAPAVQSAAETVTPVVKSAVHAAAPVVKAGARVAGDAVSSVKPGLERVLTDTGLDGKTVAGAEAAAGQAVAAAKPVLESVLHFLATSSPVTLAETAAVLVAAYYLLPPVLKASAGALRGYAGDVSPAGALDAVSTQGGAVIVDIRSAREKEAAGIPDLPNAGKLVELEYASIVDRKIRGQLRNVGTLELKITGMQIAALKRLNKGDAIFLLDRNGGVAKAVARELASRGFGKVYVISGGFSGWTRDRLGTKMAATVSRVEVILPGVGTRSSTRQLPSGSAQTVKQALPVQTARRALPSSVGR